MLCTFYIKGPKRVEGSNPDRPTAGTNLSLNSTSMYPKPGRTLCFAIETKCLIPVHLSGDHAYLTLTVNPRV